MLVHMSLIHSFRSVPAKVLFSSAVVTVGEN